MGNLQERSTVEAPTAQAWVEGLAIRPFFQPILDLSTGQPLGYEVLSRGTAPFGPPEVMFRIAKELGVLWDLERACRMAALQRISTLPPRLRASRFFLNVSPQILSDPRFIEGFTLGALRELGLDQESIVIEITEKDSIHDYQRFEELIRHYEGQGFRVSLDDFGSGHSSLVTLVRCVPHFLKLDQEIVRGVERTPYKQKLVRALVAFSNSVDGKLIAEGVETWEELEALIGLGVRHAQGFLLGRPGPEPVAIESGFRERLARLVRDAESLALKHDENLRGLLAPCTPVEAGSVLVEDLDHLFRHSLGTDQVVLVQEQKPVGLVTRVSFYAKTGGPFGYPLFQRKPAQVVAKSHPLIVPERTRVTTLYGLAMSRLPEDLYDPVLVTDDTGSLLGIVTIRQLVQRANELEVQWATGANPLTGLPGNPMIQRWIQEVISNPPFSLIYADLDRFKEYNDRYGFVMGDEVIRFTARLLSEELAGLSPRAHLGHLGGDDFVIVCAGLVAEPALERICRIFDEARLSRFDPEDRERGYFMASDRRGRRVEVPLVTLSLAVIDSRHLAGDVHPAHLAQIAASLKARVKGSTEIERRSGFAFERRNVYADRLTRTG